MTTTNDITGDLIKSKGSTNEYRDGWDRIFGKKKTEGPLNDVGNFVPLQHDANGETVINPQENDDDERN